MRTDHFLEKFSPQRILEKLEDAVIGQEAAKRALVSAVWWNLYRSALLASGQDAKLLPAKMNALLIGPTGIGKTELAKATATLFEVPWVTTSAPNYSSAGYTGADVDDMLGLLLQAANGDQEVAERGIVVLDEVDKLRRRDFGGQSDVGCEAIQQAMLSLLEGCEAMPRGRAGERTKMRSHFVTFVGTGAFVGMNVDPGTVSAAALVSEGFIPEFIARWSLRIRLEDVDRKMLRQIIDGKRSAMARLAHLFEIHGIEMVVDEKAIDSLIDQAMADGFGARALNETLWARLNGLIAEIPQMLAIGIRRVVIDSAAMQGMPAWKIPGDPDSVPASALALAHPIDAPQAVDCASWSAAELKSRLEFLWKLLEFEKASPELQTLFQKQIRASNERAKLCDAVRVCEELAFAFSPACTVQEFCDAAAQAQCQGREGILMLVRYRRIVAQEQKASLRVRTPPPRKRATCVKCSVAIPPRCTRCPICGAAPE